MATLKTLVSFNNNDGASPDGSLIADAAGNLFGTTDLPVTFGPGVSNPYGGTVFEIAKTDAGYASTPTTLVAFNGSDGSSPDASLIADAAGNLFGTTTFGGTNNRGTVFELANTGSGYASTATVLANFNISNGDAPDGSLIADAAGNLFGTTDGGGTNYAGTVFEIFKTDSGYISTPTTLFSFNGSNGDGPGAGLMADAAGNLLGTTYSGGTTGNGTVFEIIKTVSGYASAPTTLVSFNRGNGGGPIGGLIADAAGNLFGTTSRGGTNDDGTVFEIAKTNSGYANTPTTLFSFNGSNGSDPRADLITDAAGNLFGTTSSGGPNGDGTVFEIAKTNGGYASAPSTLVNFNGANGSVPFGSLLSDASGNLFGTTDGGGSYGYGTVFELQPGPSLPSLSITGISPDTGTSASDGITNVASVTVNGSIDLTDAGLTVSVFNGTALVGTTTADASGNWSLAGVTLAEGANSLTAMATGLTSAVFTATLDTAPPVVAITAIVPNNASTATINGTIDLADVGRPISLYDGTPVVAITTADASGNFSFTGVPLSVANDAPTVRVSDAAGNTGSFQDVFTHLLSATTLFAGDRQQVYGTVQLTTINNGGEQNVYAGATATNTTLNAGGIEIVWGTDNGALINGGSQYVYGNATNATVSAGAQVIEAGGRTNGTTVDSGAEQDINVGGSDRYSSIIGDQNVYGSAYYTSVFGVQRVNGIVGFATIFGGGEQDVYASGLALDTIVESDAVQVDWGDAFRTTIDGGAQFVIGLANDTIVFSGAQYVNGTANTTTIDGGGVQDVFGGGQASDTAIRNGTQLVYGTATNTTISNAGFQDVHGGASNTTVNSGGEQNVYADGTAAGTTLNAGATEIDWGAADTTAINGGSQFVYGTATDTAIDGGGEQEVFAGGQSTGTTILGATQLVYGAATNTTIGNAGFQDVHGSATNTTVNGGGEQNIYADGRATGTTLNAGGTEIDWGTDDGALINGGSQYVFGTARNTAISSGVQYVGGTANTTAVGGEQIVYGGGLATNTTIVLGGSQLDYGIATGTTINEGVQYVHGSAANTTDNGTQLIYADGTATNTDVEGSQYIFANGVATDTAIAGGRQYVGPGGIAIRSTINRGVETVYAGGTAQDVTFGGPFGRLFLGDSSSLAGAIFNFQAGNTIDLAYVDFYLPAQGTHPTLAFTEDPSNTFGILTVSNGTEHATLTLHGQYSSNNFALSLDVDAPSGGGTLVTGR